MKNRPRSHTNIFEQNYFHKLYAMLCAVFYNIRFMNHTHAHIHTYYTRTCCIIVYILISEFILLFAHYHNHKIAKITSKQSQWFTWCPSLTFRCSLIGCRWEPGTNHIQPLSTLTSCNATQNDMALLSGKSSQ